MPWFAVDDGFDTHPKVRKAGNAAAGLFCRLGAHCAKHLTEGLVDGATARDRGTAAQLQKLVAVGLLHPAGHDCHRCEQPEEGGYVMHDYLDYNRSRKQVESAREHGRKRQAKGREKQAQGRAADESAQETTPNGTRIAPRSGSESDSFRSENEPRFDDGTAGQGDVSRRYTLEGGTAVPSQPIPASVPPQEEQRKETASYASPPSRIGDRPRIPAASQPLVDALDNAGLIVGWDLDTTEWFLIEALIQRCNIPRLVVSARSSWQGARKQPRKGNYFIPGWRALSDAPAQPEPRQEYLPAAVGDNVHRLPDPGHRPSTTDARVNQAVETGRRLQALADAQQAQENQ